MQTTLLAIGVEQRIGRVTLQHRPQLPGEIDGIANALAHALADKWRLLVRSIASNKDTAFAPLSCDQRIKAIARLTQSWPSSGVIHRDNSCHVLASVAASFGSSPGRREISQRR